MLRTALLAGVTAFGLAGMCELAQARSPAEHLITLQLPNGAVEQIRYAGDVPPQVILSPEPSGPPDASFGPDSPFAMLDRISAEMDQQMAAMMQEVQALAAQPMSGLTEVSLGNLPPGAEGWSFASTLSGNGVCTRSVQVTYSGVGQPHVVSRTSGNCSPAVGAAPSGLMHPEVPRSLVPGENPHLLRARYDTAPRARPYQGLVHEAAAWHG
jgi:hypothetical protein